VDDVSITYGARGKKENSKKWAGKNANRPRLSGVLLSLCSHPTLPSEAHYKCCQSQPEVIEVTTIHHLQHETPRTMCVRIEGSGADTGLAKSLHHVVTLARGCNRCSARPTQSGELL